MASKLTPEGELQKACVKIFEAVGWVVTRQNQHRHSVTPGYKPGVPDLICCVRGRWVGVEFKQPGKKLSDAQKAFRKKIKKTKLGIYQVIHSVDEAYKFVEEIGKIV